MIHFSIWKMVKSSVSKTKHACTLTHTSGWEDLNPKFSILQNLIILMNYKTIETVIWQYVAVYLEKVLEFYKKEIN